MKNGSHIRHLRSFSSVFHRLSIRMRIAASILFAFLMVLPVVGLSLFYYSDLLSNIKTLTDRDVRLGRTATDLAFLMLDIQRRERNFRMFGDNTDRTEILALISRADSVIRSLEPVIPEHESGILDELRKKLANYSGGFEVLVDYVAEFPPDKRLALIRSRIPSESGKIPDLYKKLRAELESATSASRDSLLAEAVRHIDVFSLDRIVSPGPSGTGGARIPFLQQSLDISRQDFIRTSNRLAALGWTNMENHKQESFRIEARAKRNILFIIILTGILCAVLVIALPKSIVRPVRSLGAHIRGTGNGDKDFDLSAFPNDEVGELAAAYAEVIEKLRHFDDLKTKKIASQKRFIERLLDYLIIPVCIMNKSYSALYMNSRFVSLFGQPIQQKIPEGGLDFTTIPEMRTFIDEIRKKISQNPGDFTFTVPISGDNVISFKCRPVRNTALALETVIIAGGVAPTGKDDPVP